MYRRILGIISMNSQGISPLSPYMQYWKSLASHISEENKMIAIQQLAQLIQDLPQNTSQLESSSGSALYSFVSCISHSCSPNVSIRFQKPDSTISLVAIRDIEEGEIINQCYIDAQVSVEERLLWLKVQYNIDCKCIRCIQETNNFRAIKNANILIEKHRSNFKDKSQKNAPLVSSIFNTDSNQKERIEEMDLDFILSFYYSSPLKLSLAEKKSLLQKKYFLPQIASLLTAVQQKKDFEKTFGFILEAKPSLIPTAGLGAFVKGTVKKGSIVCFYGGISIPQEEAQRIKQDPNFESYLIENSYLISRYDGVMIDGQYYKKKILTPLVYKSSEPNPFQVLNILFPKFLISYFNSKKRRMIIIYVITIWVLEF